MQIKSFLLLGALCTITGGRPQPPIQVDPDPGCIRFCTEVDFEGDCYDEKIEFDICKDIPHWKATGDLGSSTEVRLYHAPHCMVHDINKVLSQLITEHPFTDCTLYNKPGCDKHKEDADYMALMFDCTNHRNRTTDDLPEGNAVFQTYKCKTLLKSKDPRKEPSPVVGGCWWY